MAKGGEGSVSKGNATQKDLQQEGLQRKAEGTSLLREWNMECKDFESGSKLENLKNETQKNTVSILGVIEVSWQEQSEIRSGDYTVYVPEVPGLKEL
jgi:hypothetical protein